MVAQEDFGSDRVSQACQALRTQKTCVRNSKSGNWACTLLLPSGRGPVMHSVALVDHAISIYARGPFGSMRLTESLELHVIIIVCQYVDVPFNCVRSYMYAYNSSLITYRLARVCDTDSTRAFEQARGLL